MAEISGTSDANVVKTTNEEIATSLTEHLKETVEGFGTTVDPEQATLKEKEEPGEGTEHENETPEEKEAREEKERAEAEAKEKDGKAKEGEVDPNKDNKETKAEDDKNKEPEPGKPVPYDRFSEVVEARNSFKRQLEEAQTPLTNYQNIVGYCQQNNITPQQFDKMLEVQGLINTDPGKAVAYLETLVGELKGVTGDKLPDDLQKRVDDGKLEVADAKEMARLRAQLRNGETANKQNEQRRQQQAAMKFQQDCTREAQSWEQQKRGSDPDYKPKANESAPDGKWEDVRDKYLALLNQVDARGQHINVVQTPQEMVKLLQRAYDAVHAKYTHLTGARNKPAVNGKRLVSNGAPDLGTKKVEEAKTMTEAVSIMLAQRGK